MGSAPQPSLEDRWRALAAKAAGGRFEALRGATAEGLAIEPLYPRASGAAPQPWRGAPAWAVSQRVDHPDPARANALALLDLEGGADALTLVTGASAFARGYGLAPTLDTFDAALAGVELDLIGVRLDAGGDALAAASALADLAAARRLTSAGLRVDLGVDPLGVAACTGGGWRPADLDAALATARRGGFAGCALLADGRPWHEAGAGEAQELAAALATGVAYLRHLTGAGHDLAAARDEVAMLLAVDADVFLGLAKLRAARRLWARVEEACGLAPAALRLHAETSWRAMTRRDPEVNVMRAVAGTAAAGLGGADAVTVLPLSLPLGLPDDAARRLARNVGRVLIDEANLAMVDDAAAGAGGLDGLTGALCLRAWALFQRIEAAGGIDAGGSDVLRDEVAETAAARRTAAATLAQGITGTSRFPRLDEPAPRVLDVRPRPDRAAGGLPRRRDAAPFEALRDRAEAASVRPSVYLARLGGPASYGARAAEAANALAAAGIAAVPGEGADGFAASGTRVACLCGTDAGYAEAGAATLAVLRAAGARRLLLVGRDAAWRDAGVDALIHEGADMLAVLAATLDALA